MKSLLNNVLLIIMGFVGVYIINLVFMLIIPIPDLSVQSYFWNGVQTLTQLFSLCAVSFGISWFSKKYAKINALVLGSIFLLLSIFILKMFWNPLIPALHYGMITLVLFTLPSAYLGYFLSQKFPGKPTKI